MTTVYMNIHNCQLITMSLLTAIHTNTQIHLMAE